MSSYEKTKKQYIGSTQDCEARKFEAGLRWYMKEKELIIKNAQPDFDGFGQDLKSNISYQSFIDEYVNYIKTNSSESIGRNIGLFEESYRQQIHIKKMHNLYNGCP